MTFIIPCPNQCHLTRGQPCVVCKGYGMVLTELGEKLFMFYQRYYKDWKDGKLVHHVQAPPEIPKKGMCIP